MKAPAPISQSLLGKAESSKLHSYLKDYRRSIHREVMMRHQLLHDIHLTFAVYGQRIDILQPEADALGYDVVLDDLMRTRRLQLKTKLASARTRFWEIRKILLRPDTANLNGLPFVPDSGGHGYFGGVILSVARVEQNAVRYEYRYTDALVISAMHYGIHPPRSRTSREAVDRVFREMTRPDYRPANMRLKECCFWRFTNLRPILALAGFSLGYTSPPRGVIHDAVSALCGRSRSADDHPTAVDHSTLVRRAINLLEPLLDDSLSVS